MAQNEFFETLQR